MTHCLNPKDANVLVQLWFNKMSLANIRCFARKAIQNGDLLSFTTWHNNVEERQPIIDQMLLEDNSHVDESQPIEDQMLLEDNSHVEESQPIENRQLNDDRCKFTGVIYQYTRKIKGVETHYYLVRWERSNKYGKAEVTLEPHTHFDLKDLRMVNYLRDCRTAELKSMATFKKRYPKLIYKNKTRFRKVKLGKRNDVVQAAFEHLFTRSMIKYHSHSNDCCAPFTFLNMISSAFEHGSYCCGFGTIADQFRSVLRNAENWRGTNFAMLKTKIHELFRVDFIGLNKILQDEPDCFRDFRVCTVHMFFSWLCLQKQGHLIVQHETHFFGINFHDQTIHDPSFLFKVKLSIDGLMFVFELSKLQSYEGISNRLIQHVLPNAKFFRLKYQSLLL